MGSTHHHKHDKHCCKHDKHEEPATDAHKETDAKGSHQCASHDKEACKGTKADQTKTAHPQEAKREPKPVTITDIELEKLRSELAEYKDKYLRALAETENARKRIQKEKQEMIQYAQQQLIIDFLHPIDHMENALKYTQQMSEEVKHWAIGFQMILTQFKDVLTNNGVAPFTSEGKPFDPHLHEAVEAVPSEDTAPNTVLEESVKGYKMGDRVIRPARVKVAKAPAKE